MNYFIPLIVILRLRAWQKGDTLNRDALSLPLAIRPPLSYKISTIKGHGLTSKEQTKNSSRPGTGVLLYVSNKKKSNSILFSIMEDVRAEETDQWIKCLVHKHEDPSLISVKKL